MYPAVDVVEEHYLVTEDGHEVYYECIGNPNGVPLVYLHGGPGGGASVNQRKLFDPDLFFAVLIDQRGSGRSRPLAESDEATRATNTTQHLISDLEAIRESLGIERWVVFGISWGTTLGLAYATAYPERCLGVVVALVTTTTRAEVKWITRDVGCIFPEEYERFVEFIPPTLRDRSSVEAYAEMLWGADADMRERAALEWCRWEDTHVSLAPGHQPNPRFDDPQFRLRFARLVTHYWSNHAFLDDNVILERASLLTHLPVSLIHGKYDVSSPLATPWELHKALPQSVLRLLTDSGHGDGDDFIPTVLGELQRVGRAAKVALQN